AHQEEDDCGDAPEDGNAREKTAGDKPSHRATSAVVSKWPYSWVCRSNDASGRPVSLPECTTNLLFCNPDVIGPWIDALHVERHVLHVGSRSREPSCVVDRNQERLLHRDHLRFGVVSLALCWIGRRLPEGQLLVEFLVAMEGPGEPLSLILD